MIFRWSFFWLYFDDSYDADAISLCAYLLILLFWLFSVLVNLSFCSYIHGYFGCNLWPIYRSHGFIFFFTAATNTIGYYMLTVTKDNAKFQFRRVSAISFISFIFLIFINYFIYFFFSFSSFNFIINFNLFWSLF